MNHIPYAVLKRIGEFYTEMLGGINLKLWNVYGREPIGIKSHVIPDLIDQALSDNVIRLRTDGLEERMFLHADDFARGIVAIFENYDILVHKGVIDISTTEWTSILTVATTIQSIAKSRMGKDVTIIQGESGDDSHTKQNQPDLSILSPFWKPEMSLSDGILSMF